MSFPFTTFSFCGELRLDHVTCIAGLLGEGIQAQQLGSLYSQVFTVLLMNLPQC